MLEKYHPIKKQSTVATSTKVKQTALDQFMDKLNKGDFDNVNYDEPEPKPQIIPQTDTSLDTQLLLADAVASAPPPPPQEVIEGKQEAPVKERPVLHCVFLKYIPKDVKRDMLEGAYIGLEGFVGFMIMPPMALKHFAKVGFIVFETRQQCTDAVDLLNQQPPVTISTNSINEIGQ